MLVGPRVKNSTYSCGEVVRNRGLVFLGAFTVKCGCCCQELICLTAASASTIRFGRFDASSSNAISLASLTAMRQPFRRNLSRRSAYSAVDRRPTNPLGNSTLNGESAHFYLFLGAFTVKCGCCYQELICLTAASASTIQFGRFDASSSNAISLASLTAMRQPFRRNLSRRSAYSAVDRRPTNPLGNSTLNGESAYFYSHQPESTNPVMEIGAGRKHPVYRQNF